MKCGFGFYTSSAQATECLPCPAGLICGQLAEDDPTDNECPEFYVCPQKFDDDGNVILGPAVANICDEGKYTAPGAAYTAKRDKVADCVIPPTSEYVKSPLQKGSIAAGYESGSNTDEGEAWEIPRKFGSLCPVGHYCQNGSKTPCQGGHYCAEVAKVDDTLKCYPGFYCEGETPNIRPTKVPDDQKGDYCPQGQFCEEESATGTNCDEGTFSSARGL